jgi:hypothetical protein
VVYDIVLPTSIHFGGPYLLLGISYLGDGIHLVVSDLSNSMLLSKNLQKINHLIFGHVVVIGRFKPSKKKPVA